MIKSFYIPKRFILTFMAHCGFFVVYALRVNLSVAMVAMVNSTYANVKPSMDPECNNGKNLTIKANNGEFNWNQNDQGILLSSFFYGYLLTQLPGGWIANKFGGKWVYGYGVLCTALLTLMTPIAAKASFYLVIMVRILEGIGEGVTFPAMHAMAAQWSPPDERSRMCVLAYGGMMTGTILSLPISGLLADSNFLGGWPSIFYIFGVLGIIWFVAWIIFASDSPQKHTTISYEEKTYILSTLKGSSSNTKTVKVPWLKMFSSIHLWAATIAHFCNNWVWYMVLTGLPSYFDEVLNFSLKKNAFLSALPFIVAFIVYVIAGYSSDFLRRSRLTTTQTRRLMGFLGFIPTAGLLVAASYASCNQIYLSVAYMVLATGFLAFNSGGYSVNHLDLAPRYSGILMGITNTAGTIAGCITPSVTGYFTNNHPTREQYRKVFSIAASICAFGGIFFMVFVSGEQQSWNNVGINKELHTEQLDDHDERIINPAENESLITP